MGRSRGGFSSKAHLIVDGRGNPLAVKVTAGQRHESREVEPVMSRVSVPQPMGRPRKRPKHMAGDKGYSYPGVRRCLRRRGVVPVIPQREDQRRYHRGRPLNFNKSLYRRRNAVERCVGWIKENRRVSTRYEKLAVNYEGMFKLAMIQRHLRTLFSNRT